MPSGKPSSARSDIRFAAMKHTRAPKWWPSPPVSTCKRLSTLFRTCGCQLASIVLHRHGCIHTEQDQMTEHGRVTLSQTEKCANPETIWKIRNGPDGVCPVCLHHIKNNPNSPLPKSNWSGNSLNTPLTRIRTHFQEQIALQAAANANAVRERHREICAAFWVHASRLWKIGELELEDPQTLWEEGFGSRLYCCEIEVIGKGQVSLLTRSWERKTFSAPLSTRLHLGSAKSEPEVKAEPAIVRRQYRCERCQDFPIPEGCGECD